VFLSILINTFFLEVQSFSSTNSNISGFVECDITFEELFTELANVSFEDYLRIISDTPFSGASSFRDYLAFRSRLESFIRLHIFEGFQLCELSDKDNTVVTSRLYKGSDLPTLDMVLHRVLLCFPYFKQMFYRSDQGLPYSIGDFSNSVSRNIGIHRFRGAGFDNIYACNAFSLNAIKGPSTDNMVIFLSVFQPCFQEGVDGSLRDANYVIPGDSVIDISTVTIPETLLFLFNFSEYKPNTEKSVGGANTGGPNVPDGASPKQNQGNPRINRGPRPGTGKRNKNTQIVAKKATVGSTTISDGNKTISDPTDAVRSYSSFSGKVNTNTRKPIVCSFEFNGGTFMYTNPFYSTLTYDFKIYGRSR
jgi:hypothetical protein